MEAHHLTLAALDLGLIAMIAGIRWVIGTQRSANITNGTAGAVDRDNLEHGSNADHVQEQDLLLLTDAGLITVIIGVSVSLILIVIGELLQEEDRAVNNQQMLGHDIARSQTGHAKRLARMPPPGQ
jgi:hypothetical protein